MINFIIGVVASYVGAWIETFYELPYITLLQIVASYVGAWIETPVIPLTVKEPEPSHPMWVRGLKHHNYHYQLVVGVSHPMWVRGLKHAGADYGARIRPSHPMWVRGLKPGLKEV